MTLSKKIQTAVITIITIILFLIMMVPFFIVVINSAKASLEIITDPISLPERWGQLFENIKTIWNKPIGATNGKENLAILYWLWFRGFYD